MLKNQTFFSVAKFAALFVATIFFINSTPADMTKNVVSALAIACIFALELIWLEKNCTYTSSILNIVAIVFILVLNVTEYFVVFVVCLSHLLINIAHEKTIFIATLFLSIVYIIVYNPGASAIAAAALYYAVFIYVSRLVVKNEKLDNKVEQQKETIDILTKRVTDNNNLIKSLAYTTSLEERNRLATKIHDKVGHGISGSIIMLEASVMILDKDKDKALTGITNSIENLRTGVDEIRLALREEKPSKGELGKSELKAMLDEFTFKYSIETKFEFSGDLERLRVDIWSCIKENIAETQTNMLKYSKGSRYTVSISIMNKVAVVKYIDNGKCAFSFKKGLGLRAIEERTERSHGRCLYDTTNGFVVTNIFDID